MFAFIKGKLAHATPGEAVIEAGGIGYRLQIPASVYANLPQTGSAILLQTAFVVREQSQTLYGFLTEKERDHFEVLMGVNGIGPKLALTLIGHLPAEHLHQAIASGDAAAICKIPGIGKKTAERLILEIRDKLPSLYSGVNPQDFVVKLKDDPRGETLCDALSALVNLGYNRPKAEKALQKALASDPALEELSELITASLKHL